MKTQKLANEMYQSMVSQIGELSIRKSQLEKELDFLTSNIKEIQSQLVFLDKSLPHFKALEQKPVKNKPLDKNVSNFSD